MPPVDSSVPLIVDLDGTVIQSDVTWESIVGACARQPLNFLRVPFWFLRGRPYLKRRVSAFYRPDPVTLPYRQHILDWLREEKEVGRQIILASASHAELVTAVAEHLDLFDDAFGTDGNPNLSGSGKVKAIGAFLGSPDAAFDYAGDSAADLAVWKAARASYVVHAKSSVLRRAKEFASVARVWEREPTSVRSRFANLQPSSWLWNVMAVILPLAAGVTWTISDTLTLAAAAVSLSALTSVAAIVSSIFFIESDRQTPSRQNALFATGSVKISSGLKTMAMLLVAAVVPAVVAFPAVYGLVALPVFVGMATAAFRHSPKTPLGFASRFGAHVLRLLAGTVVLGTEGGPTIATMAATIACLAAIAQVFMHKK